LLHLHDEAGLAIGEEPSASNHGLSETHSHVLPRMTSVVHVVSELSPPVKIHWEELICSLIRPSASTSYSEI
jgi:hypothetical protein